MKKCGKCKEDKNLACFHETVRGHSSYCKDCNSKVQKERYAANKESHKQKVKEWQKENKAAFKNSQLKKYGITVEDYDNMLQQQDSKCKICKVNASDLSRSLAVDHCHLTGKIRGLLCNKCNRCIGLMKDDTEILSKAIEYLKS